MELPKHEHKHDAYADPDSAFGRLYNSWQKAATEVGREDAKGIPNPHAIQQSDVVTARHFLDDVEGYDNQVMRDAARGSAIAEYMRLILEITE
jgi:hypothetical protein